MSRYPFKFLNSYDSDDRDIFFGRNDEIDALYEMVFQSSVILVYGASGTGKTSLINCGLAGKFQPHDWLPLMIRRGNNINDALAKALDDNGGKGTTALVDINWHDEWSDDTGAAVVALSPVARSIKAVYQKYFRPVYLIFDQFEELYILGSIDEQELFVDTVQKILQSEQPVKMIFSIREEYLGYLYEFERKVPQLLRKKIRIEAMTEKKVAEVIERINNYPLSNVHIKEEEADAIKHKIFEKLKEKENTLTIQLPYLQVFLDKIYTETTHDESHQAEALITLDALSRMGDIGDVLSNFLEEQVQKISKAQNIKPEVTWKILSQFCTLEGTKQPISEQAIIEALRGTDKDLIKKVVKAFIDSRILRPADENLYELTHDSLALRIAEKRSDEDKAILQIQRLVKSIVEAEPREFFSERQLLSIEPYKGKFNIDDEEQAWIYKSAAHIQEQKQAIQKQQQEELAKTRKQLRTVRSLLAAAGIALTIAVVATIFASIARNNALKDRTSAQLSAHIADSSSKVAKAALIIVNQKISTIGKIEFDNLKARALIIRALPTGQPVDILKQMDSIAATQPDNVYMRETIEKIKNPHNRNENK